MENEQTQQHHHLWQQISPLLPALLSTQRASWEQGVTAQALLELYLALHSSSASPSSSSTSQSNPNLPDPDSGAALIPGPTTTTTTQAPAQAETDTLLLYIYNLTHDALVRASSDGRLATRINGEDASALDPACVGEAVLFVRDMYIYFDGLDNLGSTPDERSRWQTGPERMVRFLVRDAVRIAGSGASSSSASSSTIGDHEDDNNIEIPPSGTTSTETGTGAGAISHLLRAPQLWSDGGYMGPPFLAAAAVSRSLSRSCFAGTTKTKDGHNDNAEWIDVNTTISPSSLLTEAFDQILLYARYLRRPCTDPGSGTGSGSGAEAAAAPQKKMLLLAHIYDGTLGTFAPIDVQHGQYGHAAWGVGMGWFVNGIVRVMRTVERALCTTGVRSSDSHGHLRWLERWLKEDDDDDDDDREGGKHSSRIDRTASLLVALLDGILPHQRPQDGLFHNVVDDGGTSVETNLAQMLAAAIFRICTLYYEYYDDDDDDDSNDQDGKLPRPRPSVVVRALRGVLDRDKLSAYEAAAERMYVAARGKRDRWGLVQGVCGSPGFSGPGTATEGQAWAVLMEVARWEWCRIRRVDTTT
ncbi:hypothetical protein VTN00DRAFT_9890 [Thermoascus crustaceus]|uniref:uncharacterized protein n=1 Tax=Thermoascus crustaceus TaxID=5088 RepID=UPI003743DC44